MQHAGVQGRHAEHWLGAARNSPPDGSASSIQILSSNFNMLLECENAMSTSTIPGQGPFTCHSDKNRNPPIHHFSTLQRHRNYCMNHTAGSMRYRRRM
ncbi:hypothetical protein BOSE62_71345 [Bosea sp. 62]|nr:hypothetical protein BOSE21B_90281 [Bosea sp. 21B]CAD5295335.1 hypothetical protein BOSE46_80378 [Bosea sp. 46]CAD5298467.1 hypothetical protein BOSE7B_60383 [Bosea sp. 7B]VXB57698.1 hypothetical protein BOSE125_131125 [Bosea sp. 125]VXC76313.1 hypothetical protein BOSE29B_80268 [Bosea sp. 29B]VXC90343.1 hypothetical protein BOSE62_71345 [Bosea sp. 62]